MIPQGVLKAQLLIVLSIALTLISCHEKSGVPEADSAAGTETAAPAELLCPSWSGAPSDPELYSRYLSYDFKLPGFDNHGGACLLTRTTGDDPNSFEITGSGSFVTFDFGGWIFSQTSTLSCSEAGLLQEREVREGDLQVIGGPVLELTSTVTYDPPMQLLPRAPEVGDSWEVAVTRTTTRNDDDAVVEEIEETRWIAASELVEVPVGLSTMVRMLRVESSSGQRWWYGDGLGLFKSDDILLTGTCDPGPD